MTFPYDEVTASSNGDTLNRRSMDQIVGFSIRTFVFKYAYISAGISINNRRVETNIEKYLAALILISLPTKMLRNCLRWLALSYIE